MTSWIVKSPLIWPYINKELLEKTDWSALKRSFDEKYNVYEVLKQIGTKEGIVPFLYGQGNFKASYFYLVNNGFDLQKLDVAEVGQDLIDEMKEYFDKYVSKKSIEGFIDKVKKAHIVPFAEESGEDATEHGTDSGTAAQS